jgi:hypothetical protein
MIVTIYVFRKNEVKHLIIMESYIMVIKGHQLAVIHIPLI